MEKVLIATTNKDKYSVVSKIFKKTIFPEDDYEIVCLTDNMNIPDEKETGNNKERARAKALNAFTHLKEYNFDYIVGLDDAMIVKGKDEPNIKEYINKILFENYLDEGEQYAFNRAYAIIDKDGKMYEVDIAIPYEYHKLKKEFKLEDHSYPLSYVSSPVGSNIPVSDLSDEEATEYFLKYVKDGLMNLGIKKH